MDESAVNPFEVDFVKKKKKHDPNATNASNLPFPTSSSGSEAEQTKPCMQ